MVNYILHKLPEGFIITSDKKIKLDEKYLDDTNTIRTCITETETYWTTRKNYKKVIAQQDQIDFSTLSEEEQKKIGWFDIEKLAEQFVLSKVKMSSQAAGVLVGFIEGFQKAQELSDRMFTEEDMKKAIEIVLNSTYISTQYFTGHSIVKHNFTSDEIIESLSQKSWKVELEMEECAMPMPNIHVKYWRLKFTNDKVKILKLL